MEYIAAMAAHGGFIKRFAADLVQPGIRVPLTADPALFHRCVDLGRQLIWLHTYGERCADPAAGRPAASPRVPAKSAPKYPRAGAIPTTPEGMPDSIAYDEGARRLHIGTGYFDNVAPEVWAYEVSGKAVLKQWFSYRRHDRDRPIMGDRRPPSALDKIQPDHWLAEYTTDLVDLLHVLTALVALEPELDALLGELCAGPLLTAPELAAAAAVASADSGGGAPEPAKRPRRTRAPSGRRRADPDQSSFLSGD